MDPTAGYYSSSHRNFLFTSRMADYVDAVTISFADRYASVDADAPRRMRGRAASAPPPSPGASGSPGGRAELLVLRKSLSPAGPPPDKPFSFCGILSGK